MDARAAFEARLSDLRGRRITAVDYWDVHNYGPEPVPWNHGDWHHAVMGVHLATDRGPVTVTWTSTFHPYGIEVFHDPITDHLGTGEEGPERVGPDDAHLGPWERHLGTPVRGTASYWDRLTYGPATRSDGTVAGAGYTVDLPWAVRLDFDTGSVWFVAAMPQPPEMRTFFAPADEIVVAFSADTVRAMGFDGV